MGICGKKGTRKGSVRKFHSKLENIYRPISLYTCIFLKLRNGIGGSGKAELRISLMISPHV